jgi:hypothetical protein
MMDRISEIISKNNRINFLVMIILQAIYTLSNLKTFKKQIKIMS